MANMTQTNDIVAEIKHRLDVLDVVSERVILKKSGRNYWGLCPFHKEKTPSFSVNPEKGIYKCFGCGESGDAISFLMKTNNQTFWDVIVEQAQKFGLELPTAAPNKQNAELKTRLTLLNEKTASYYHDQLLTSTDAESALKYLEKRGITRQIIQEYKLGYAPKLADSLVKHLKTNYKATNDELEKAGLVVSKSDSNNVFDRFRNRIIIPINDENGVTVAFGARALEEGQNPKYLNSPDTLLYNKSHILFGLDKAKDTIKAEDAVIFMEGYFDVISAQASGLKNVVATSGTALTQGHLKLISRYTMSRKIFLSFDTDSAGIKAANRGAEIIKEAFVNLGEIKQFDDSYSMTPNSKYSCEIRIITPPSGKDPDEYIRENGLESFKEHLKNAPLLIDFQINNVLKKKDDISTPQEKAAIVKEITPILAEIQNDIIKNEYVKLVSMQLKVDEKALLKQVIAYARPKLELRVESTPIVKKSSNIHILAQKNLLSLYFIEEKIISFKSLNDLLKDVNFPDENLGLIKNEIDKISYEVNNVEELINRLLEKFADNEDLKAAVIDLIYSTDDKKGLSSTLMNELILENIKCINKHSLNQKSKELKQKYRSAGDDDPESLICQYEVLEQLKRKNTRMEIINE